jgi:hypothetical protein
MNLFMQSPEWMGKRWVRRIGNYWALFVWSETRRRLLSRVPTRT